MATKSRKTTKSSGSRSHHGSKSGSSSRKKKSSSDIGGPNVTGAGETSTNEFEERSIGDASDAANDRVNADVEDVGSSPSEGMRPETREDREGDSDQSRKSDRLEH